ncbi:CGNR zinc finger domain-containing protein [Streptomyces sp. NPDC059002]|uniref:CGNR zinc finger domain-containing protein n=1 Tax=Streptomyces sp. NPDC059002 TaxID=3346690 RepID=UPI0036775713
MKRQDAPGALELVREFINTRDLETRSDGLDSPDDLRSWLTGRELIGAGTTVDDAAWQTALEVREALRALAATHSGRPMDPAAARTLDTLAADTVIRLRFRDDGTSYVGPEERTGVRTALGRILALVDAAAREGTWPRLKVCPAEDCLWVFYDHSKNRSGTWCQMAECGNRAKGRAFRARTRTPSGAEPSGS